MHGACALLYPATHPYSRPGNGTIPTVERLTREDVLAFHQCYHPAVTALAVVGAVDVAAVIEALEQAFGGWEPRGSPPELDMPPAPRLCETRRCDITIPGTMQSDVIWAVPGPRRTDPDYYAASVANTILGRLGLGGRLGDTLRKQCGLAYHCASILDADIGPNPWMVIADVNPAGVTQLIDAIQHEILRFCSDGTDNQELRDAHAFMSGSLALGLETNDGIAAMLLTIEWFGLGLDYVARYPALVRSITAEQVVEVARAYLGQEHYVVAVAGPAGSSTNGTER
jgi:zinc protease